MSRSLTTSDVSLRKVAVIYDVINAFGVDMHVCKSATLTFFTALFSAWSLVRDLARAAHTHVRSIVGIPAQGIAWSMSSRRTGYSSAVI
jgi:hypothetical protein